MKFPLVSVVIPTRKKEATLKSCLKSIRQQTYKNIETVVVDLGLERSYQRNWGAKRGRGKYLLFVDADMELSPQVIRQCVNLAEKNKDNVGIIIPEKSFGQGFWAQCKRLEKSFYVGVDWIEAARFFNKKIFLKAGGYDEERISGEDWDLSQRISKLGNLQRVKSFIYHNEGRPTLKGILSKKFFYAKNIKQNYAFLQDNVFQRYLLFFRNPTRLFSNPIIGLGVLFMKSLEFFLGATGYILQKK